ncbi:MAG: NRDE family protein, partial [Pseudomonas sp.]|nr:NRDE family protein [Pseudomonas sp.]
ADHLLPDTGVGLATERLLSSVFIASTTYGTRASTVLNLKHNGGWSITERSFGPYSTVLDEIALRR